MLQLPFPTNRKIVILCCIVLLINCSTLNASDNGLNTDSLLSGNLTAGEYPDSFFREYISNLSPNDYKGEPQVWSIETDDDGFIYLVSGGRLSVSDGYDWTSYSSDDNLVTRDLKYDADSRRLYCAGDHFFGYWYRNDYGRMSYIPVYSDKDWSKNEIFWRIIPSGDSIYIQTHESVFLHVNDNLEKIAHGDIGYMLGSNGHIYVQIGSSLCRIHGKTVIPVVENIRDRIVLVDERDDKLLIIGESTGFKLVDKAGNITGLSKFEKLNGMLSGLRIFSALRLRNGSYIVGTVVDGAYVIDDNGNVTQRYNSSAGLANTTILSINEDYEGTVRLGADGGMAVISMNVPDKFYYTSNSYIGNVYTAVIRDENLYLGTNKGLFAVSGPEDPPVIIPGSQGQIWDIVDLGSYLAVVADKGLYVFNPQAGSFVLVYPRVWQFIPIPRHHDRYLASVNKGLCIFSKSADGNLVLKCRLDNYTNPNSHIVFDRYGYAWVNEHKGSTMRLCLDDDLTKIIDKKIYSVGNDYDTEVRIFTIDDDVLFVSGTDCYSYAPEVDSIVVNRYYTDMFRNFGTTELNLFQYNKYFFNYVNSSVDLLQRFGTETRVIRNIFEFDELSQLPPKFRRIFKLKDDLIGCGFTGCLGAYDLNYEFDNSISEVSLYNASYEYRGIRYDILNNKELRFPYGASNLEFRLSSSPHRSLDFKIDDQIWRSLAKDYPISIGYASPGVHTISIRDGNMSVYSKTFIVGRHFTASWWFILSVISLLAGGAIGTTVLYRHRLERLKLNYEAKQKQLLEKEQIAYQNEILSLELKERDKKLTLLSLNDMRINSMLSDILSELEKSSVNLDRRSLLPVRRCIEKYKRENGSWKIFEQYINSIFDGFIDRLRIKYPNLTNNDMKICAYIRLGMTTKEIAAIMNIEIVSAESARYRLRKNMNLKSSESLSEIISNI